MITVVGLGVAQGEWSEAAQNAVKSAERVILRTDKTEAAQSVISSGVAYETLDHLYESGRSFSSLAGRIAKAVWTAGKTASVVYCVDGSALDDRSAQILCKHKNVRIIGGVSKAQKALEIARIPACSRSAVSAYDLTEKTPLLFPAVVYDLDDRLKAGDVKLILSDRAGEESEAFFVQGGKSRKIKIYELDRQKKYDYSTCVVVGETPLLQKTRFTVDDLKEIIERLRRPDGCPWDRVQTPESIRSAMIEEAYELVDAIDKADPDKICEETGDVLLQAVFHAVMQQERGAFNLTDAVSELCRKLIFRHSHIFGSDHATDEAGALSVWEANKAIEKGQDTYSKAVNDVPLCFPALMRAQKVQKRAGKSGFDFACVQDAEKKIEEELGEWRVERERGDEEKKRGELGDLLFSVVNAGRLAGVDCELALKESVDKFVRRFNRLEEAVIADGKDIRSLSAEELDGYYRKIKD